MSGRDAERAGSPLCMILGSKANREEGSGGCCNNSGKRHWQPTPDSERGQTVGVLQGQAVRMEWREREELRLTSRHTDQQVPSRQV